MVRNVSFCTLASMAVLLLCSDANAFWRGRGCGCGYGYGYGSSYGGCATTSCGCGGGTVYSGAATGTMPAAPTGPDTSGTATNPPVAQPGVAQPGVAQPGVDAYGRPYNPGGIGGPASGIGVRPGLGAGGLGPRR
jgi:hypothetical protein